MEHIKHMRRDSRSDRVTPFATHPSVPDRQLSKFFKALSDQTRRNILRLLENHPLSVGEIVDNFQLSQPTISRHLAVLREADLVVDQRRGQHVIYQINSARLAASMLEFFREFRHSRQELERLSGAEEKSNTTPLPRRPRPTIR